MSVEWQTVKTDANSARLNTSNPPLTFRFSDLNGVVSQGETVMKLAFWILNPSGTVPLTLTNRACNRLVNLNVTGAR